MDFILGSVVIMLVLVAYSVGQWLLWQQIVKRLPDDELEQGEFEQPEWLTSYLKWSEQNKRQQEAAHQELWESGPAGRGYGPHGGNSN